MLLQLLIALTTSQAPVLVRGLDISARLSIISNEKLLTFTIENNSMLPISFDEGKSPCAPSELVTVVFIGGGGIGTFIERNSLTVYSGSKIRKLLPHEHYKCDFNISSWFHGRIPQGSHDQSTILLWSYKPEEHGIFNKELYGGAIELNSNK